MKHKVYFIKNNKFIIQKSFDGGWDVYKEYEAFVEEYQATFKYLREAKKYIFGIYNL